MRSPDFPQKLEASMTLQTEGPCPASPTKLVKTNLIGFSFAITSFEKQEGTGNCAVVPEPSDVQAGMARNWTAARTLRVLAAVQLASGRLTGVEDG